MLNDFLFFFYTLFIFSSIFSIAIAQTALGMALIIFLILILYKRFNPFSKELQWFYLSIAIYISWLFISSLMGPSPLESVTKIKEEWLFVAVIIGIYLFKYEKFNDRIITVFSVGIIIVSIYGFIQFFTGIDWFLSRAPIPSPTFGYRISGFFSYGVTFGNYFSVAASFLIAYALFGYSTMSVKRRSLILSAGSLAALMTLLTLSRAPILALIIILVFIFIIIGKRFWKLSLAGLVILVTIIIVIPGVSNRFANEFDKEYAGTYEGGRVFIWKNTAKLISDNQVFGVGKGNFKEAYAQYLRDDIDEIRKVSTAHNDFLDIAATTGLPGLLFYILLWLTTMFYFWRNFLIYRRANQNLQSAFIFAAICGSFCFLITSMFHGVFVDDEVRHLLMFIWAFGLYCYPETDLNAREP